MTYRKKLIEVALPLEEINAASAREKSIRHGHPSTLHLWWSRKPLAAARAVLFASIVDDPGEEDVPPELLELIDRLPLHRKYRHLAAEEPTGPGGEPLSPEEAARQKRARERRYRLFTFLERLVQWENSNDPDTLQIARDLIRAATGGAPPPVLDPFCGGGAIPLEAQRLGLEAHASDLNPVAVLITKAMIEIPPRFAGRPPVNPDWWAQPEERRALRDWKGAEGLAEDVRYYGQWMREEAERRIGHLYPKVEVTAEMAADRPDLKPYVGRKLTVIAWLWARTVRSPNPAFAHVEVPLVSSFLLSSKAGKEAYVEPVVEGSGYRFTVKVGKPKDPEAAKLGTSAGRQAGFRCLMSGAPIPYDYIRSEGRAGRMGARLMAIVAEGPRGRIYLPPLPEHDAIARQAQPGWRPETPLPQRALGFRVQLYGMETYADLFTPRQLVALTTFSDLIAEVRERVKRDALAAWAAPAPGERSGANAPRPGTDLPRLGTDLSRLGTDLPRLGTDLPRLGADLPRLGTDLPRQGADLPRLGTDLPRLGADLPRRGTDLPRLGADLPGTGAEDAAPLHAGGAGAAAYADAVATYLAFAVDRSADYWSAICSWHAPARAMSHTFTRQAIPMVWAFAECDPFSDSTGNWTAQVDWVWKAVASLPASGRGVATQADATRPIEGVFLVSTDPPYFDNIGYADLSDFFYVWLRRSLGEVYPDLFATMVTPKAEELIASPYRHGDSKEAAKRFFEEGLRRAFDRIRARCLPGYPVTIYYAYKQRVTEAPDEDAPGDGRAASTGWEAMLQALMDSGFTVTGTWPIRTEMGTRQNAMKTNALASSIVLACRPRPEGAPTVTRRQFASLLRQELAPALAVLTQGNVAPVDLAQAAIGPGMAVFSRYAAVLEDDGTPMRVRPALQLINQALDEVLEEQEGWYDPQTRWAVTWFRQHGFREGPYGEAETLATAKDAPVDTLVQAGIARAGQGKVRLLTRSELPADYDPASDARPTVWEATQYLARALATQGELGAARMMRRFRETKPDLDVERARDLAYRLYAICDQKRWADEARAYNGLVISWSDIEKVSLGDDALWDAPVPTGKGRRADRSLPFEEEES